MRLAGLLLLLAGWAIVVGAIALFAGSGRRELFVAAGLGVEMLGLVLAFRKPTTLPKEAE